MAKKYTHSRNTHLTEQMWHAIGTAAKIKAVSPGEWTRRAIANQLAKEDILLLGEDEEVNEKDEMANIFYYLYCAENQYENF